MGMLISHVRSVSLRLFLRIGALSVHAVVGSYTLWILLLSSGASGALPLGPTNKGSKN